MQVGDNQQALFFPKQRAGEVGDERHAGDRHGCSARRLFGSHKSRQHRQVLPRRLLDEFVGGFRQQLVGCFAIN